jgi:hypothetical protein
VGKVGSGNPLEIDPNRRMIAADMAKTPPNPPLSLVASGTSVIPPPRPLGPHGAALWNAVQAEYAIADRGGIELLAQACGALDLVEALGKAIERDGAIVYGRAGPKAHPAVKDQIAARAFVVRTLERLGLNIEAVKSPGRPSGFASWAPR